MADKEVVVKYTAEVDQYNKEMDSMIESTEKAESAQDNLKTSTADLGTNTKTTAKSVDSLSKGIKSSTNVFSKYGQQLTHLRGPTKLFAHALGLSAQSADQLRITLEHTLQTIGASIGPTQKATAATKTAADATKKLTIVERALNLVRNAGLGIWLDDVRVGIQPG